MIFIYQTLVYKELNNMNQGKLPDHHREVLFAMSSAPFGQMSLWNDL